MLVSLCVVSNLKNVLIHPCDCVYTKKIVLYWLLQKYLHYLIIVLFLFKNFFLVFVLRGSKSIKKNKRKDIYKDIFPFIIHFLVEKFYAIRWRKKRGHQRIRILSCPGHSSSVKYQFCQWGEGINVVLSRLSFSKYFFFLLFPQLQFVHPIINCGQV